MFLKKIICWPIYSSKWVKEHFAYYGRWWTVAMSKKKTWYYGKHARVHKSKLVSEWGRKCERDRNDEDEGGSWRSRGGLTVIYVAVGSLASCLIKVVSLDRGRAAKLLTRKFSRQSPRLVLRPTSSFVLPFLAFPDGLIVGAVLSSK